MAYNPYEYRDNREGIVGATLKVPYRATRAVLRGSPEWGPNVAVGQGVHLAYDAYKRGVANQTKRRAMEVVANRRKADELARLRGIADKETAAARSAANRAGLRARVMANRAVEPTRVAQSAWDLAKQQQAESAARIAEAKSGMGERIAAAKKRFRNVREHAKKPVRTNMPATVKARMLGSNGHWQNVRVVGYPDHKRVVQNFNRPKQVAEARSVFNAEFKAAKSTMRTEVAAARADYQAGRDLLAQAMRNKRKADYAARTAADAAKAAARNVGDVAAKGEQFAQRAARWVYDASMKGAPTVTRAQRLAMGTANVYNASVNAVKGAVKSTVGTAADMAKNVLKAVNPFGSKEAVSAALGKSGAALSGGAKTAKAIGNWAIVKPVGSVTKAGKFIAGAPVKGIASAFNAIEKAGQIATAGNTGKAAKLVRGVTSASSLAGSFAFQAWSDAAENMYKFYAEGGKLSDVGKQRIETINGKQVAVRNPGWSDVIFSRDFAKGVLKGTQSALTLGLAGKGDDTFFDRVFAEDPEEENKRLNAQLDFAQLRDIHGNSVYTAEQLNKMNQALSSAAARTKMEQDFVTQARGTLDVQNFRKMLGDITAEKAATMQMMEDNIANFSEFSKTLRGGVKTEDEYRQAVTANAEKTYERRMKMLLGNKAAKDVMEENRRAAYAHSGAFGSGDYDVDVKNAAHADDLREFNKMWNDLSDADRVSWNKEDADRAVAEAEAEYEKANPPKPAEEEAA